MTFLPNANLGVVLIVTMSVTLICCSGDGCGASTASESAPSSRAEGLTEQTPGEETPGAENAAAEVESDPWRDAFDDFCAAHPSRPGLERAQWALAPVVDGQRSWLPLDYSQGLQALLDGMPENATSLRHEGSLLWIDLRQRDTWALLSDVDGPISFVVDAATLMATSEALPERREHLLDELIALSVCLPMALTVVLAPGPNPGAVEMPLLLRLTHLHGLHFTSSEGVIRPDARPFEAPWSRRMDLLAFSNIELALSGSVVRRSLGAFAYLPCDSCEIRDEDLEGLATSDIARVLISAHAIEQASADRFRPSSPEELPIDASIRSGGRELLHWGDPDAMFGAFASDGSTADPGPLLLALIADRVGEDYFELEDATSDEGEPEFIRRVTRHCGADARTRVAALGDDWTCDAASCGPSDGCDGVACARVSFDGGRVLAHWRGVDADGNDAAADALTAVQAARLRQDLECGASRRLEAAFFR